MEVEETLEDIYEEIADKLAEARTRALMGERETALGIFHGASLEFTRFREVLQAIPGFHALDHAFNVTMTALCMEQAQREEEQAKRAPSAPNRTRKRAKKAA